MPDDCEVAAGTSLDCNANGVPDECDVDTHDPDDNGLVSDDCDANGSPDECDLVGVSFSTIDITVADLLNRFLICQNTAELNGRETDPDEVTLVGRPGSHALCSGRDQHVDDHE